MQFVSKHHAPQTFINPFIPMATGKNHQPKKQQDFKTRKIDKTDHEAVKRGKIQENMLTAMPVDGYQPLFKKLNELVPIDRNRYR